MITLAEHFSNLYKEQKAIDSKVEPVCWRIHLRSYAPLHIMRKPVLLHK